MDVVDRGDLEPALAAALSGRDEAAAVILE